ncbi:MAG: hypothetical protein U1E64_07080 [Sphingomonadaceae bacterium]
MNDPRRDPALAELLDGLTVPPLSADFADRVVAAATHRLPPLPAPTLSRRGRRARWIRGHRVVIGVVAFGLMSAGAAATAIFGDVAQTIPVIGPLIARVVPAKAEHKRAPANALKPKPEESAAQAEVAVSPVAPAPLTIPERLAVRREVRREFVAERIADRLQQRAERREALGLPPRAVRPAEARAVLRRIPPADRAAIVERVREIRQERRATALGPVESGDLAPVPGTAPAANEPPAAHPLPEAQAPDQSSSPREAAEIAPERAEQLRRLRALRELQRQRRDMRRQRLQQ